MLKNTRGGENGSLFRAKSVNKGGGLQAKAVTDGDAERDGASAGGG